MKEKDIEKIKEILKSRRKKTNCFSFYNEIISWMDECKADFYLLNDCIFIFYKIHGFYKFYYFVDDYKDIKLSISLLEKYKKQGDISLEFTTKNDRNIDKISQVLEEINFNFYAKFVRMLNGDNKLSSNKTKKFYEIATLDDLNEISAITNGDEFNRIIDDIPTEEELKSLINNKCVAVKHINNEIIYIQICELGKNTIYSRLTWIKKEYRKPKYSVDIYNGINDYIDDFKLSDNLRLYFWVNTSSKNYKILLFQGGKEDGVSCSIFTYKKESYKK